MEIFIYFFVFVLGSVIGSFLNVVVLRLNTGRSIGGRSMCFSCGKTLRWFELVPIFSFLWQKGRCRSCKSKISWQYIAVEILTGIVFLLIFIRQLADPISNSNEFSNFQIFKLLYYWVIFSILIALSVYDLRHKIIPDVLVFSFIILSFIGNLMFHVSGSMFQVLLAGFVITSPLFFLWLVSRGRWMGFGDVKLAIGFGFFLGLPNGIYAILWSFWIGGAVSIILLILGKILPKIQAGTGKSPLFSPLQKLTIKSEIPFGPFMVLGLMVAFFLNWDFLHLELVFSLF